MMTVMPFMMIPIMTSMHFIIMMVVTIVLKVVSMMFFMPLIIFLFNRINHMMFIIAMMHKINFLSRFYFIFFIFCFIIYGNCLSFIISFDFTRLIIYFLLIHSFTYNIFFICF